MGGDSGLAGFGELLDIAAVRTLMEHLYSDVIETNNLGDRAFLDEYCQVSELAPDALEPPADEDSSPVDALQALVELL